MDVTITWVYQSSKNDRITLTSESVRASHALVLAKDIEKTGRVKELYFVDEFDTKWIKKELEQYVKGVQTEPHNIVAYFDGGYDKESKLAGLGIVIYFEQNGKKYRIRKNKMFEEIDSNNEAEYAALWALVQELEELGVNHIPVSIFGDSQVVLNQVLEDWPVFEEEFKRWLDRIEDKVKRLGIRPKYNLIARKENKEADQLATQALNKVEVSSKTEIFE